MPIRSPSPPLPPPTPSSLVRIVRIDLRPESRESSTEEKPLAPPTESPLRPRDPHHPRSRDSSPHHPVSLTRPFGTFLYRGSVPPPTSAA